MDGVASRSFTLPSSFIELKKSPQNSESFFQKLQEFLEDKALKNLRGSAAAEVVNFLDQLITDCTALNEEPLHRGNAIRVLYSLSGSSGELPASCIPQEEVVGLCALAKENLREVRQEGFRRIPQGGTREIWRGTWRSNRVAVKVMKLERRNSAYSEMLKEQLSEETISWRYLKHHNLLPLDGVSSITIKYKISDCLVSPWMENGNIVTFVKENPNLNRFEMLVDVCEGLIYLHSQGFVHSGLNGDNVLIDSRQRACLADFCLTGVYGFAEAYSSRMEFDKSLIYNAPEQINVFCEKDAPPFKKPVDVYALGVLIFEVLLGEQPFDLEDVLAPSFDWDASKISSKFPKPNDDFEDIGELVERCLKHQPNDRPQLEEIRYGLKRCASKSGNPFFFEVHQPQLHLKSG